MYAWIVRKMIRRAVDRLNAGDVGPLLDSYADDVRFVFPGRHSWAADFRGKEELEPWLQRFVSAGLTFEPQEIVVSGPPWNTTVCVRFTDHATGPDGEVVYSNRGVIFGKAAWGKVKLYEVYEDTQKVAEFDEYLASREASAASGGGEE